MELKFPKAQLSFPAFGVRRSAQGRIRIHGLSASVIDENEKLQEKNRPG
jgi:hypothetical protein